MHALLPVADWVDHPAGQIVHAAALDWPVIALYVPAAQGVRVLFPGQKCPAVQEAASHEVSLAVVAPVGPNCPGGHMVPVHDVAREQPAALYRPAGQSAQALQELPQQLPRPVSYCPAPHPVCP